MINSSIKTSLKANYLFELASVSVSKNTVLQELVPPKHFSKARFINYIPEAEYPSQREALHKITDFVLSIKPLGSQGFFRKFIDSAHEGKGLYLDGGFGVGKTHLLASAYHSFQGKKAYLSFQELMFLVGLHKLSGVVSLLKDLKLLIIDEFELDDPANSRISTNLLGQLFDAGVSILTSSNTPPGALGEGKFSVEDFRRELGELTKRFTVISIDGEDYRITHHLDEGAGSSWTSSQVEFNKLVESLSIKPLKVVEANFDEFLTTLAKVHPMRIRRALSEIDGVILQGVHQISNPHEALLFVYFIDKAYDNNLLLIVESTIQIEDIFQKSYFTGGDTKKYLRTISRLKEMTKTGFVRLAGN